MTLLPTEAIPSKIWKWQCHHCGGSNGQAVAGATKGGEQLLAVCRGCGRSEWRTIVPAYVTPDRRRKPRNKSAGR